MADLDSQDGEAVALPNSTIDESDSSEEDSDSDDSDEDSSESSDRGFSSGGSDFEDNVSDDDDNNDEDSGQYDGRSATSSIVPGSKSTRGIRISFTDETGVRTRMKDMITDTADILAIDPAIVEMLLLHFKWNGRMLQEQWFDSPDKVFKKCGFNVNPADAAKAPDVVDGMAECDSCGDDEIDPTKMHALQCGHFFCHDCWLGYLAVKMEDGPGSVFATCMQTDCGQAVLRTTWSFVNSLDPSKELLRLFDKYITRSYCNENAQISWCPAALCDVIIVYVPPCVINCTDQPGVMFLSSTVR